MVVGVEPAVKGFGAFSVGGVELAVGPAAEHGADEALCFAVGLRASGSGAEVADAEGFAGEGVDGGAVGRAIVGEEALDGDAVAAVERDGASEEGDRRAGLSDVLCVVGVTDAAVEAGKASDVCSEVDF